MSNAKCHCPANLEWMRRAPPPDVYALIFGSNPNKATIRPDNTILIDAVYWEGLSPIAQDALLAHEKAHSEPHTCANSCDAAPQGCEHCADRRAGAIMRHLGYSLNATKAAFQSLQITSRRGCWISAQEGWMQA